MTQMYGCKGQFLVMRPEEVVAAIVSCEKSLRTAKVTYVEHQATQSQIDEVKTSWPDLLRNFMREKAKELAGQGNPITLAVIRRAFLATCQHIAEERARLNTMTSIDMELRQLTAELNLATLFGRAIHPAISPNSILNAHRYQTNGKLMRVRSTVAPRHLIVNMKEIDSAEIYVLALYVEAAKRSILLAYTTKEDLKKAKAAETATDLPEWKQKSYYIALADLRPMSELYKACNLTEIPAGLAMESVPQISALPIPAPKELQDMMRGQSKDDCDFLSSVGIASKKDAPKLQSAPAEMPSSAAPLVPKNDVSSFNDL